MATVSASTLKVVFGDYAARVLQLEQDQDDCHVAASDRVDKTSYFNLFHAAKRLSETDLTKIPEDEAYQLLKQRANFKKQFKDNFYCATEYAAYRTFSKQLQATLPWAKNRVEYRTFDWSVKERMEAFKSFLSKDKPIPRTDFTLVNFGPYIDLPPATIGALEDEFSMCYRALNELNKTRAGNFYQVYGGNSSVYGHRNYPFVFRVAPKEQVDAQLKQNARLHEFVDTHHLNFIKVPQSTVLDLKGHPELKVYVEHKIEGMVHPNQIEGFWSNILSAYIYDLDSPATDNLKNNLQTLVHQLAVLVGKFPYPTRIKDDSITCPFVGSDASAVYATSIFAYAFGKDPTPKGTKAGLDGLVSLFPLNSILNNSILKEFPDHPITERIEARFDGSKTFIGHSFKWREPDVPLKKPEVKPVEAPAAVETPLAVGVPAAIAIPPLFEALAAFDEVPAAAALAPVVEVPPFFGAPAAFDEVAAAVALAAVVEVPPVIAIPVAVEVPPAAAATPPKPRYFIKVVGQPEDDLYIRGEKGDLNWVKGVKMTYDNGLWTFGTENDPVEFKILKGDSVWEKGHNHKVEPHDETMIYSVKF